MQGFIRQCLLSCGAVVVAALFCGFWGSWMTYQVVALFFLLVISLLAAWVEVLPVLIAGVLSAFIWNFFFIVPLHTFSIGDGDDVLMFMMYLLVAALNAILVSKIRLAKQKSLVEDEQAKALVLYKTLFNSLSHELKTPIFTIMGAVDTLKERGASLSEAHTRELIEDIEIASSRLHRQVGNLLNMSRLESGMLGLKLDWCDGNELVFGIIDEYKDAFGGRRILFEPLEQLPLLRIDAGLVGQVLRNILHNALVYTPVDSTVGVGVYYKKGEAVFEIADDGEGIPLALLGLIFNKFYRLPNSVAGGTGLGLSIAKGFAEAHGGRIEVENKETGGARFRVYIPCQVAAGLGLLGEHL